ncbi:GntR family transcriptional regulator [Pseudonocardia sp.]|uniref:GntR family transcriptional regulator n=1 Tax=Pseudonocardia sp. TaxID=60912 RepID=UPI00261EAF0C|nr:GntR family transcriptional regulator [Pseudonocardia sp.]
MTRAVAPLPAPGEPVARPLVVPGGRDATDVIHADLRGRILSGDIAPGTGLSQARIAKECLVSRGPVREAFRLLQREGLIEVEVNQRARVTDLSVEEAEHLYALRVSNETLALGLSVSRFSPADLDELDRLVDEVAAAQDRGFDRWEALHHRLHMRLVAHAGRRMLHSVTLWAEHTGRYRKVYVGRDGSGWTLGAREHAELARLCRERDARAAATLLARHLSRAGLALIASMDPAHEPALLRAAIRQALAAAAQGGTPP